MARAPASEAYSAALPAVGPMTLRVAKGQALPGSFDLRAGLKALLERCPKYLGTLHGCWIHEVRLSLRPRDLGSEKTRTGAAMRKPKLTPQPEVCRGTSGPHANTSVLDPKLKPERPSEDRTSQQNKEEGGWV